MTGILQKFLRMLFRPGRASPSEARDDYAEYDKFLSIRDEKAETQPISLIKISKFNDIAYTDTGTIQEILRATDLDILRQALYGAQDSTRRALLSCMARRSGRLLWEELETMSPIAESAIVEAENRIMTIVAERIAAKEQDRGKTDQDQGRKPPA